MYTKHKPMRPQPRPFQNMAWDDLDRESKFLTDRLEEHRHNGLYESSRAWWIREEASIAANLNAVMAEIHLRALTEYREARPDRDARPEVYRVEVTPATWAREASLFRNAWDVHLEVRVSTHVADELWTDSYLIEKDAPVEQLMADMVRMMWLRRHTPEGQRQVADRRAEQASMDEAAEGLRLRGDDQ